ncbi:DUF2778 domain-containing protein [Methylocystis sp. WRRC1]|uniref:DUF2778 domain-containing protein n=1 Tax=Methylocystis sp. WRRC1 TaxID=1732014 RepID=UPI001D147F5C|nr:DUF2778 domain-containing protein [Methylocystis sp. WRRC1]MCC3245128.1 DUF2778 domain-containing protein [Methylocystis sp. WRRC1]
MYPRVSARRRLPRVIPALGALALSLSAGVLLLPRATADAAPDAKPAQASAPLLRGSLLADLGPHKPTAFAPRGAGVKPQTAFVAPTPPVRPAQLQNVPTAAVVETAPEAAADTPLPPRRPAEYSVASRAPEQSVVARRPEPQQEPTPVAPTRLALPAQPPRQIARTTVVPASPSDGRSFFERLFGGAPQAAVPQSVSRRAPQALAYAAPDAGGLFGGLHSAVAPVNPAARYDRLTAVYDISARTVYLPNGQRLEAHSGLGAMLDDPRYVHVRMRGATPPHVYELTPREALFHGVEALRLNPVGGAGAIHGRAGLLAHTFMLGPNGDSNGCVSFRDYNAFLRAYKNGEVRRLAVVAHL